MSVCLPWPQGDQGSGTEGGFSVLQTSHSSCLFTLKHLTTSKLGLHTWLSVKNPPASAGDAGLSPGPALEEEMATQPRILAWEIPWADEPDGLQSVGKRRVRHDGAHVHLPLNCKHSPKCHAPLVPLLLSVFPRVRPFHFLFLFPLQFEMGNRSITPRNRWPRLWELVRFCRNHVCSP